VRNVRTRVKVCGLASAVDAAEAVRAGADALGVILAESSRQVTLTEAEEIFAGVPPFVARVGVFVDAPVDYVERAVARLNLAAVQFHGSESPERCAAAPAPVIKAVHVGPEFDVRAVDAYRETVVALLFDTYVEGMDGGTGRTFPWEAVAPLPSWAPVIVAGGLTPVNVGGAIRALAPYGVDVSSGVEERLRQKDRSRLHAFVAAVRAADEEVRS
jgi:phosphoribosylanthranilate isomerase